MKINLPQKFRDSMIEHAIRELPNECCGVLIGRGSQIHRVIPIKSNHPSPDSYFMDPEEQMSVFSRMKEQEETLVGIYHSHPEGPEHPSDADLQFAFHRNAIYFIVSLRDLNMPVINAFMLKDGSFRKIMI
jgi:proteasome lid subunit RPN8/RPN11